MPSSLAVLVLVGCAPFLPGEEPDDASVGGGEPCLVCALTDENQYRYAADLRARTVPLAAGADALVRWDTLAHDIHGHPRDPVEDIDAARLVAFRGLGPDEVLDALERDDLSQSAVTLYLTCAPTDAACALTEFGLLGNVLDVTEYFVPGQATWLVALASDDEPGASAFLFLDPTEGIDADEAVVDDDASALDVDVDFESLAPVRVPVGRPDVDVDWSGVTRDGLGNPFYAPSVDGLLLARYDATPAELAERVFDLEEDALERWSLRLEGSTHASLADVEGDTPFAGVAPGSTWVLALRCSSCLNPAPRVLTFLEPVEGAP